MFSCIYISKTLEGTTRNHIVPVTKADEGRQGDTNGSQTSHCILFVSFLFLNHMSKINKALNSHAMYKNNTTLCLPEIQLMSNNSRSLNIEETHSTISLWLFFPLATRKSSLPGQVTLNLYSASAREEGKWPVDYSVPPLPHEYICHRDKKKGINVNPWTNKEQLQKKLPAFFPNLGWNRYCNNSDPGTYGREMSIPSPRQINESILNLIFMRTIFMTQTSTCLFFHKFLLQCQEFKYKKTHGSAKSKNYEIQGITMPLNDLVK